METELTVLLCEHASNRRNEEIRSWEWRESKCDTPATCLATFWPANPETNKQTIQICDICDILFILMHFFVVRCTFKELALVVEIKLSSSEKHRRWDVAILPMFPLSFISNNVLYYLTRVYFLSDHLFHFSFEHGCQSYQTDYNRCLIPDSRVFATNCQGI